MEIPPHEISPQQDLKSEIKNLENTTNPVGLNKRFEARQKLAKINGQTQEIPIQDELKLINNQAEGMPDSLPALSDQRITLYTELKRMSDPSLTPDEAKDKGRQIELDNLQEILTTLTDLNKPFSNNTTNGNNLNKRISKITTRINKIKETLPKSMTGPISQLNGFK